MEGDSGKENALRRTKVRNQQQHQVQQVQPSACFRGHTETQTSTEASEEETVLMQTYTSEYQIYS